MMGDNTMTDKKQSDELREQNEETVENNAERNELTASSEPKDRGQEQEPDNEFFESDDEQDVASQPVRENEPAAEQPKAKHSVWPWIITAAAVAALVFVLVKPSTGGASQAVAKVNGETITQQDLYNFMVEAQGGQSGQAALDQLISDKLVDMEAAKTNTTVTDADVDAELAEVKKQFPSEDEFNSTLQQYGMTLDDLKKSIKQNLKSRKIFEPQVTVKDEDVKKYYDENKASFSTPEQVRASHILVKTKEEADAILKQLKNGGDFAAIAKEKNEDATKDKGGDLGFFSEGQMVKEFDEAVWKMKVGELSEPVKTQYGYHIIKLTDKKPAVNPTFDEKKAEIAKLLKSNEANQKASEWLAKAKTDAKIENFLKSPAKA